MNRESNSTQQHPGWVKKLEQAFGEANQAHFGTAVFYEPATTEEADLEQLARKWYEFFCGPTWEKFGVENWLATWQRVDTDSPNAVPLIDELAKLEDSQARRSGSTMLEGHEDPEAAKQALSQAFDDHTIKERRIYRVGDGGAMSGILIAGRRNGGESAFLTFLLD